MAENTVCSPKAKSSGILPGDMSENSLTCYAECQTDGHSDKQMVKKTGYSHTDT